MTPTSFKEWSPVKELLTMLAQLLSLKSGGNFLPEGSEDTAFIAAEVFKNPLAFGSSNERFLHTVHLLPTLHNVQSKMAHWIETLPSDIDQKVKNDVSKGENPKEGQSFLNKSSVKTSESELLASKAQRLVGEVRITIQTFSTSSFLSNPQPGPLRDALAKLKPLVDELIEALSQNTMDPHQEGSFTPFKHQAIFQKSQEKKEAIPLSFFQDANTTVFSEKQKQRMKSFFHPRHLSKPSDFSSFSKPEAATKSLPSKTPNNVLSFSKQERQQDPIATPKKEDFIQDSDISRRLNEPQTKNSRDTSSPSTTNFPKPPLDRTEENEIKLQWTRSSSHLISNLEEKTGQRASDRLPIPICLPNPASGTLQRPLASAKKKRQKRYFFKDDLQEDDSSASRE